MSAALANHYALNWRTAAGTFFYCPMLMIHLQVVIVIASLSLQVAITAKGGSAMLNAAGEHCHNTVMQLLYFIDCE